MNKITNALWLLVRGAGAVICALIFLTNTGYAQRVVLMTDTNGVLVSQSASRLAASNGLATSAGLLSVSNALAARFRNPLTYRNGNSGVLYLVGDSIGYGKYSDAPGGSTYTNGYIRQVASALGLALTNASVSGHCVVDRMQAVFTGYSPSGFDINVWALGANDSRLNASTLPAYGELSLAQIAWLCFAGADKITRDSTNVSYYGTWGNDLHPSNIGRVTGSAGDAVVISNVFGSSFVIGCSKWKPSAATAPSYWKVYVDGAQVNVMTNWLSSEYVSNTGYANNYVETVLVVTNLAAVTHVVALTNALAGFGTFEWLASPQMALNKPQVYVMEVTRQTQGNPGYLYWGGSDVGVASFNSALQTNVALLASIGLDVTYVPVCGAVDPRYDLTDGLHPGTRGHTAMANALLNAISGWRRSQGTHTLGLK